MRARPRSVLIIGCIFIAVGCFGIVAAARPLVVAAFSGRAGEVLSKEIVDAGWAAGSGIVAALGGAFLIRGARWARWLLVAWMVFHIGLSLLHSVSQTIVHVVLFSGISFFLFRPGVSTYLAQPGGRRATISE